MTKLGFPITKRTALATILVITVLIVIDSTIVKYVTYTNKELSTSLKLQVFISFFIVFSATSIILLKSINENGSNFNPKSRLRYFDIVISVSQYLLIFLLIIISSQMIILENYNILSLLVSVSISYIFGAIFLVSLVVILIQWFRFHRNYSLLLYAISFSLILLNTLISAAYFTTQIPYHLSSKKPYPIHLYLVNLPRSELVNFFGITLDVLSLLSFIFIWAATVKLLSQYRNRIGRVKYITLVGIPLIYFLFPFETYFANFSHQLISFFPLVFSVIYIIFFSATKQVGGILFGMVYLTASSFIKRPRLRTSVLATAIGMVIIFSSIEIDSLIYAVYPPFGLITICFIPLGSYLLLVGIYTSARRVAEDAALRKEFYKKAENQLDLLKSIGLIEMEKELLTRYKPVLDRSNKLQGEEIQMRESEDVKEIIHDVLQELQARERQVSKNGSK